MGYHAAIRKEKNLGSKVLSYIYIKIFKVAKNKKWKKKQTQKEWNFLHANTEWSPSYISERSNLQECSN